VVFAQTLVFVISWYVRVAAFGKISREDSNNYMTVRASPSAVVFTVLKLFENSVLGSA
jgi:hypothetical protein